MFEKFFNLTSLNGINGFSINNNGLGLSGAIALGSVVNTPGDMNGDGIGDVVTGTNLAPEVPAVFAILFLDKTVDFPPILVS